MHRPAPLARPLQPLRGSLRSLRGEGNGPSVGIKLIAGLIGVLGLLWVVAIYTPIAHPRDLEVDGATGLSESRIRAALVDEASRQSTFNVSEDDLMLAVSDFPEVAAIKIAAHPPFRLDLQVVMRPPVGRAQIGGRTFTVAGDGTVLERASEAAVPKLDPSLGSLLLRDGRLTGDGGALHVLAGAPETFLEMIRTLRRGEAGLEVELERGPRLIFGSADHAADKWAAATAVIADGNATHATYIDVRVPGRPAVGGIGGSKTAGATDAPPSLTALSPQATNTAAPTSTTPGSGIAASQPAPSGATTGDVDTGTAPPSETGTSSTGAPAPTAAQTPTAPASGADVASASNPSGAADSGSSAGAASAAGGVTP